MRRSVLTVCFLALTVASVVLYLSEHRRSAAVMSAFTQNGMSSRKQPIAEAARLAPRSDIGSEIFAAAAGREWLSRHRDDPKAALIRDRLTGRLPWGYPHPWPWPNGDYASEFLGAKAEMETTAPVPSGSDLDVRRAHGLLLQAVAARPAWRQHRRTLEALALASRR